MSHTTGEVDEFASFSTVCPKCGNDGLTVIQATLVSSGAVIDLHVPLEADGFVVGDEEDGAGIEDERVRCDACGCECDLSDLLLA